MIESIKSGFKGWLASLFIALLVVFVFKTFIGVPTTVKGTSMASTLHPDDKLFLCTWDINFNIIPKRGTIITFEAPSVNSLYSKDNCIAIYNGNSRSLKEKLLYYSLGISNSSYIKRVIGLPGDHVQIKNNKVYINGTEYKEDYLDADIKTDMEAGGICDDVIVPENCVYVLGDNRAKSVDSRKFGCIPIGKIEGRVVGRWWQGKE